MSIRLPKHQLPKLLQHQQNKNSTSEEKGDKYTPKFKYVYGDKTHLQPYYNKHTFTKITNTYCFNIKQPIIPSTLNSGTCELLSRSIYFSKPGYGIKISILNKQRYAKYMPIRTLHEKVPSTFNFILSFCYIDVPLNHLTTQTNNIICVKQESKTKIQQTLKLHIHIYICIIYI